MNKILITGGKGLIGSHLCKKLEKAGYQIAILTRTPVHKNEYKWDVNQQYIDPEALKNTTHIIHLAGEGIANERWTKIRKQKIRDSRITPIHLLLRKVKELQIPLQAFVSASAIGYYGAVTADTIFKESDAPATDFIGTTCKQWEDSALQFLNENIPTTILRTGIVLTKQGGALEKMNTPFFLATLGSGQQYMPWIHIDDLCNLYLKAIQSDRFTGIFNAIAPEHHTNRTFTKALSQITNKSIFPFAIPSLLFKIAFGEMSLLLLQGSRVSSEKVASSYTFKFPNLPMALTDIYSKKQPL
ncbi:TIGR01777 family oxidoreductase [Tenacibaculum maritimum]|uniref:TIGR01777 family oxidoreductase n=1 Tax=Tenacibaculum maritimum TaxID=107401 RepID=UPI001E3CBFFD|nr:TIGR01777 family oxidoreductase [Tenacibaculum maritimum]MCD9609841.1 TIGR01777 family oxidoreductase [Tenacibaculum maritimum]